MTGVVGGALVSANLNGPPGNGKTAKGAGAGGGDVLFAAALSGREGSGRDGRGAKGDARGSGESGKTANGEVDQKMMATGGAKGSQMTGSVKGAEQGSASDADGMMEDMLARLAEGRVSLSDVIDAVSAAQSGDREGQGSAVDGDGVPFDGSVPDAGGDADKKGDASELANRLAEKLERLFSEMKIDTQTAGEVGSTADEAAMAARTIAAAVADDASSLAAKGAGEGDSRSALAALLRVALPEGEGKSTGDAKLSGSATASGQNADDGDTLFRFVGSRGESDDAALAAKIEAAVRGRGGETQSPQNGAASAKADAGLPADTAAKQAGLSSSADAVSSSEELLKVKADRADQAPLAERKIAASDVAIVDSRKYLGVATAQTAVASVVSAVTENSEWNAMLRHASSIAGSTLDAAKNASNSLKIQLNPPELGSVMATFRLSGGQMTIDLKVQTIEAYRQLSDDNSGLLKALRAQGYDIEHVTIQHTGGERGQSVTASAGSQSQGAATGGALGDGASTDSGRDRGGDTGRQGQSAARNGNGDGDARNSGRDAGGDLYL